MASIQKRPDGRWRARYRDDASKEHARHFARKVDAQRWLDEVTASVVTGHYVDPGAGRITLSAYFAQWSARQLWERGTAENAQLTIDSTAFRDVPIKAIRRSDVEAWVKGMSAGTPQHKPYAASTIATRYRHPGQVFKAAVRDKLISDDPTEGVALPRRRRSEHRMEIPRPEDVAHLLSGASDTFRPFVALCAFAGLRRGEAAAVNLEDVDFLRRVLHVHRQVQRGETSTSVIRAPKFGSERDVPIPDDLVTMLSEHVRHGSVHPAGWLFPGNDGPISTNMANARWQTTLQAVGMAGVKLHSLRHFYASGLIAEGCDVVTVQRALGHASPSVTLTVYAHLWPSAQDRTRAAAASIMAAVNFTVSSPADYLRTGIDIQAPD